MRVEQCVVLCMQQSWPHVRLCVIMDACNTFGRRARAYVDNAWQGNKEDIFSIGRNVSILRWRRCIWDVLEIDSNFSRLF